MLYARHDIPTRANAIAQCVATQLDGPPHLSPSRKADRQVSSSSFCLCFFEYTPQYLKRLLSLLQTVGVLNGHIVSHLMAIYVTSDQELK